MSTTVDNRVVEMHFDNSHFERNVGTTLSTLDKLKQSLNMTGATKGLENVNAAARNVNMSGINSAVQTVQAKFTAMQGVALGALTRIGSMAVDAGTKIVRALSIDPIMTGFSEYETQINAIQTILANTQSKGTTLKDVTGALDELNTYADQTIYNFTEMTRNIGTFTAAGVDLETSVSSIKGIANLAAVSGSSSQQASTAMYQLSQALAAGKVSLMDWNSVVNAGMGGQLFQDALKRTARNLGTGVDEAIEKYGTFRESLTQGNWLTTEVLTETLTQLSGAYSEADLIAKGYTQEQAKDITELATTAVDAATKVKTFTQLWDTLKESAQSGWTQTWELIVGDFNEAKTLLTNISNVIGDYINDVSEGRNKILEDWRKERYDEFGTKIKDDGRTVLIEGLTNAFKGLLSVLKPIKEAFSEVFEPVTGDQLYSITTAFERFTSKMTVSDEIADKIKRTFEGVFSIVELFGKAVKVLFGLIKPILSIIGSLVDIVLTFTAALGDMFTAINKGAGTGKFFAGLSEGLYSVFSFVSDILRSITSDFGSVSDVFTKIGEGISTVVGWIGDGVSAVFDFVKKYVSIGDIINGIIAALTFVGVKQMVPFVDIVKRFRDGGILAIIFGGGGDGEDSKKLTDHFKETLDSVQESLSAFTSGIKVASLASIAIAIGILSASLKTISELDPGDIAISLGAVAAMLLMLNLSFKSITKSLDMFGGAGIVKAGFSLILIATAIRIFAGAIKQISSVPFDDVVKGLFAIAIGLATLSASLKFINKFDSSLKSAVSIVILAQACKVLGDALAKFGELSWGEIGRGLTGMGVALAELSVVLWAMSKVGGTKSLAGSASLLIAVYALDKIAEALKDIGSLAWKEIGKGLAGMGGALAELTAALFVLGKFVGSPAIAGAAAVLIASESLDEIGAALKDIGSLTWDQIKYGLAGIGGALTEIGIVIGLLGKFVGTKSIEGAAAVLIAAESLDEIGAALKDIGSMTWDQIKYGLTGMGGALAEVGIVTGLLGGLAGPSALIGSGALLIGVQALGDLADAFKKFGEMTWDQVKNGLAGLGGALAEVGIISGALGWLTGPFGLIGSGSLLLAVQGLGDLADAFKKFGSMSWEEVEMGLKAMGAALGETALGGLLNTFSGFGAGAIEKMAEPLGVLADSVQKWKDVNVPEGLGEQLKELAKGIGEFTFSILGALSIDKASDPLGIMADSVKKWTGVVVPEGLGSQLTALANGVKSFTFGGLGAGALAEAAEPLGVMADSVKKWSDVTVPEGIQSDLESLANGVKAWSFAFMGGWSLSATVGPLKDLADSIKSWNDVNVPDGIKMDLEGLAEGVKAWSFAFMGGWSIDAVVGPLKKLAGSVKEWNGVTIPEGLGNDLATLATGVKAFDNVAGKDLTTICDGIKKIGTAANDISSIDFNGVASKLSGFATAIDKVDISADTFTNLGQNMINGITEAISNGIQKVQDSGRNIVTNFADGISKAKSVPVKHITEMVKAAAKASGEKTHSFEIAGYNCAMGFANGISSGSFAASIKARAMANAAVKAAKRALDEHSPSKVFYGIGEFAGIGFVNALSDFADKSYDAGSDIASSAKSGLGDAIGKITEAFNSDIDTQPTIRPVLDLTNIESGASAISGMLGGNVLATVGGINSAMNRRIQNGANSEIVSAIDRLRKDVGNLENRSYSIGDIVYSHGDEIFNAVETLVRTARVERRA